MNCEQCGSNNVKKNPIVMYLFIATFVIALIPIAGWVIAPIMLSIALAVVVIKKYKRIELMKCKDCKHQMQIPKVSTH